ncbi:hypothetical protein J6590_062354 [Homalodisca vitripennis]|nr:hypothetical protein J6590_062354 [Homalodisca vitripennis]
MAVQALTFPTIPDLLTPQRAVQALTFPTIPDLLTPHMAVQALTFPTIPDLLTPHMAVQALTFPTIPDLLTPHVAVQALTFPTIPDLLTPHMAVQALTFPVPQLIAFYELSCSAKLRKASSMSLSLRGRVKPDSTAQYCTGRSRSPAGQRSRMATCIFLHSGLAHRSVPARSSVY